MSLYSTTFCADCAAHIKVPSVSYFFFFFSLCSYLTHTSAHVYFCSSLGVQHVSETPGMLTCRVFNFWLRLIMTPRLKIYRILNKNKGSLISNNFLWNHVTGSWNGASYYVVLMHNPYNKLDTTFALPTFNILKADFTVANMYFFGDLFDSLFYKVCLVSTVTVNWPSEFIVIILSWTSSKKDAAAAKPP